MEATVVERRTILEQTNGGLRYVHQLAQRWLKSWNHYNAQVQQEEAVKAQVFEGSFTAAQVQWEPLRWWIGRVHMGLRDLEM